MSSDLSQAKTRENLMSALAGEALSCTRYKLAEKVCRQKQEFTLANLFKFTAAQERVHAEVFYKHLKQCGCEPVSIRADFPNECSEEPLDLLRHAVETESHESSEVYPAFAQTARDEGFPEIAQDFENIASVEGSHSERYRHYADLLENGRLHSCESAEDWLCLNCGYLHSGSSAPETCPVCAQPQGWYIRLCETPWGLEPKC